MILPKGFQIAGLNVTIEEAPLMKEHGQLAQCIYHEQKILIDPSSVPEETLCQTVIHEIVHWCFYVLGRESLRNDEELVDSLAHMLHQVAFSMRYQNEQETEGIPKSLGEEKSVSNQQD